MKTNLLGCMILWFSCRWSATTTRNMETAIASLHKHWTDRSSLAKCKKYNASQYYDFWLRNKKTEASRSGKTYTSRFAGQYVCLRASCNANMNTTVPNQAKYIHWVYAWTCVTTTKKKTRTVMNNLPSRWPHADSKNKQTKMLCLLWFCSLYIYHFWPILKTALDFATLVNTPHTVKSNSNSMSAATDNNKKWKMNAPRDIAIPCYKRLITIAKRPRYACSRGRKMDPVDSYEINIRRMVAIKSTCIENSHSHSIRDGFIHHVRWKIIGLLVLNFDLNPFSICIVCVLQLNHCSTSASQLNVLDRSMLGTSKALSLLREKIIDVNEA